MEKKHCQAEVQAKILRLEGEKSREFVFEEAPIESKFLWPRLNKDAFMLEKAKDIKCPDMYTSVIDFRIIITAWL